MTIELTHEAVDALLRQVEAQQAEDSIDLQDHTLFKTLVECLGDSRGVVRLRCATILGEIGKPVLPFLLDGLAHHDNVVVRRAAAKTITLIADPGAIPHLLQALLLDPDTVVQGSAVGALAQIGEPAVPPLLDLLRSEETTETTKGHAAWALAFIGAPAKPYLYPEIKSESVAVRCAVVGAIAKIAQENPEDTDSFEVLVAALNDEDSNVRCEAAATLGNLAYAPALTGLLSLLNHSDWETRKSATMALMKIGDRTALAPLQTTLAQETELPVQMVLELAINTLNRNNNPESGEEDW